MRGRLAIVLGTVVTLCVLAAACSSEPSDGGVAQRSPDDVITVGSFDFVESRLLAELYSHALEEAGYPVRREFGLGSREFVGPALVVGLIDLVPEYAGTAAQFFGLGTDPPSSSEALTHDRLVGSLRSHPVTALAEAPAQNANTFAVTRRTAEQHGLSTLSDLARVAPELVFGGAPECATRPLCLAGPAEGVRHLLRAGRPARRRWTGQPAGAAQRRHRRGPAVHLRSGPGGRRPRRAA